METMTKEIAAEKRTATEEKYSLNKGRDIDSNQGNEPSDGTSAPASGLSRFIRRMALKYRQSGFGHWLPLIFANKVNIWEGFLHNFKRDRTRSIFSKQGIRHELRHNRKQFLAKAGATVLVGAFVFAWLFTSSKRKREKGLKNR